MNTIAISQVTIRQTSDSLFNLNDLHKAAGKEKRHQPANWLATQQASELVAELKAPEIPGAEENQHVIQVKNGVGTFVCKELVYAYATWISPTFFLKVIRTFDAVINGQLETSRPTTTDDRTGLRQAVTMLTGKRGLMHDEAYRLVHQRFNVGSIDELTYEQLPEAVEYVHRLALSGELLPREDKDAEREAYIRNHQICAISLMYTGRQRYEEQSTAVRHLCDEAARAMYALEAAKTALNAVLEYGDKIQYGSGAIWDGLHESLFYLHLPDEVMAEGKRRAQEHYKPRITA